MGWIVPCGGREAGKTMFFWGGKMAKLRYQVSVAVSVLLSGLAVAQPPTPDRLAFRIEPQPMEDALTQVAQTAGLQLLFQSSVAMEHWTPGIEGSLTPEAAF